MHTLACSGSNAAPTGGRSGARSDRNPYGVAYPTKDVGTAARGGNNPGAVIANFDFEGYRVTRQGSVISPGALQPISLADYFDPELRNEASAGVPYRVLHVQVSFLWCTPCNEEAKAIVGAVEKMAAKGALFLTAVADGPIQGKAASVVDLDSWILKHKANYTHVLDPAVRNFGNFFDPNTGSFNADIDLRSMEILYAGSGKLPDIEAHVQKWIDWTARTPPKGD